MISFALDEEQTILQTTVRKFAAEHVRPNLRAWERARAVPDEARRRFHDLGLALLDVPEAAGGAGAGLIASTVVHEELGFGDAGAAVALWAPHLVPAALLSLGDAAQAAHHLARFVEDPLALGAVAWSEPAGAPLEGFATVAEKRGGGWALSGKKAFVVNGDRASVIVVFAQVEPGRGWEGAGAFVVDGKAPGVTAGARHETLGLETVAASSLALDGVFVREEDRLAAPFVDGARRFFARASLMTAARQVGLARAAYEYALGYTQERRAFGKPVAHFQSIAFTLAETLMDVESARWLLWRAAAVPDGKLDLSHVAQAAVHANEAAFRAADNAVQLLGGAGYVQDYPVEKWLRDTKTLALSAPTDQLSQLAVTGLALGQPIDAGLPSSALQPIYT